MAEDEGGERNEAATGRQLQKAREAGQVPISREAPALAALAAGALVLMLQAPGAARRVSSELTQFLTQSAPQDPARALRVAGIAALSACAPFLLASIVAGAGAVLLQTGGMVNTNALLPNFGRLSPSHGLARILSLNALLELAKALLKIGIAGAAVWSVMAAALPQLPMALLWQPALLLDQTSRDVLRVLIAVIGGQAAIAAFDIVRARMTHASALRMTREQVQEEHKESDGNPHVKGRLKRVRQQRSRKRMLLAVPGAAVVITNPTHYAVALSYARGSSDAPRVVAKGADAMAARIRQIAADNRVPLVVNPPLARALYPLELDSEIPRELFQAVADIIAYIWGLRRRTV